MYLVKPSIKFLNMTENPLEVIETAGRVCYKSEDKIGIVDCPNCKRNGCRYCLNGGTLHSSRPFVRKLLKRGHHAMIEHASASYHITCDRGVTHEIVRHRLFSYAQESTRYCNYSGGVTYIIPPWCHIPVNEYITTWKNKIGTCLSEPLLDIGEHRWFWHMAVAERDYVRISNEADWTPQQARSVLPNSLKTEIVVTGNLREWMHFFKLRCSPKAHPQMQEVANMVLADMKKRVPVIFDELGV